MLICIDFKRRCLSTSPVQALTETLTEAPIETRQERYAGMVDRVRNRFGNQQPRGGVVYKSPVQGNWIDTYGRGCVHNSIHQYRPKSREYWNRPMPFPSDLDAIERKLKRSRGETLQVGLKSDPFMWMDRKYGFTQIVLELANEYGVKLRFHTMSDLCCTDEYLNLLAQGGHSIVMHMGYEGAEFAMNEHIERLVSPGAPSLKRRDQAVQQLAERGVETEVVFSSIDEHWADPVKRKFIQDVTGIGSLETFRENQSGGAK